MPLAWVSLAILTGMLVGMLLNTVLCATVSRFWCM